MIQEVADFVGGRQRLMIAVSLDADANGLPAGRPPVGTESVRVGLCLDRNSWQVRVSSAVESIDRSEYPANLSPGHSRFVRQGREEIGQSVAQRAGHELPL
jgi:hypothetical protein